MQKRKTIFDLQSSNLFTDEGSRRRGGRKTQTEGRAKIQFGRLIFALLMPPNRLRDGHTLRTSDVIGVTTGRDNERAGRVPLPNDQSG